MIRAFQWDLARQVERFDWLLTQLPRYADWGYQELYLHLEDAIEYPSLPGVARADAYTRSQFARLVEAAGKAGIAVVPIVNLLGHTQYLVKVPSLRDLNEVRGPDGGPLERGQICPLHPRTLEVAELLIRDLAPFCTAGKLHVGLDESFLLGRHPLSIAEIAEIGLAAHFAGYASRLHGVVASTGLRMGMWADMLALLPAAIPLLPTGIIAYDWYYYPFSRLPRVELHNYAECDLAAPLAAQGIEYWGCAMNGAFRHEPMPVFGERLGNARDWWRRCAEVNAGGFLMTSWEPSRLAVELSTVVDAAAATLWTDPGADDATSLLTRGFERVFGHAQARELARAALRADEHAFTGYARWEINERWDGAATRDGKARYQKERSYFRRLSARGASRPAAFQATMEFRRYLAERDTFVRGAASRILNLRRRLARRGTGDPSVRRGLTVLGEEARDFAGSIRQGARAARAMWQLTRDPQRTGPNEALVVRDRERLTALSLWIRRAVRSPAKVVEPSPVCGRWQLRFEVRLRAPALQKVVLERRDADGRWTATHSRFTIEFRAAGARAESDIRREFSAPVPDRSTPLRIGVRGVGQVEISRIELTDGATILHPRLPNPHARHRIGAPPQRTGFPILDWETNTGEIVLEF